MRWGGDGPGQAEGGHCAAPSVAEFAGQAIRLRFKLEDCKLYSFRFE